jgi:hypothetical protein
LLYHLLYSFSHDLLGLWLIPSLSWLLGPIIHCRADKTPKEAAAAIQQLWETEWATQVAVPQPSDGYVTFHGFFGSYEWSFVDPMGITQRGVVHFGRGRRRRAAVLLSSAAKRPEAAAAEGLPLDAALDAALWPK